LKTINLGWLAEVLRGLINGELKLVMTTTERKKPDRRCRPKSVTKAAKNTSKKSKPGRRMNPSKKEKPVKETRGRKRIPLAVKIKKAARAVALKARVAKQALPSPRELFKFMLGKIEGMEVYEFTRHYCVKRGPMKEMLERLFKKGDLDKQGKRYFLHRRIRLPENRKQPKPTLPPVPASAVLEYLAGNGSATLPQMAKGMNETSYQRRARLISALKKAGKVALVGKNYRLVVEDPLFLTSPQASPDQV